MTPSNLDRLCFRFGRVAARRRHCGAGRLERAADELAAGARRAVQLPAGGRHLSDAQNGQWVDRLDGRHWMTFRGRRLEGYWMLDGKRQIVVNVRQTLKLRLILTLDRVFVLRQALRPQVLTPRVINSYMKMTSAALDVRLALRRQTTPAQTAHQDRLPP